MPIASPVKPAPRTAVAPHKRSRRKEARPSELIDAALSLFVEKGYAAAKVEDVAAMAGVSKGTLFLYFPSKEELFKAVVRQSIAGRILEWNSRFEEFEGSTSDMLAHAMVQWWAKLGATKASGLIKLIISEARNFPEIAIFYQREVMAPGQELMRRILQRGIDRGEFRAVNLEYAIYSVIAPMLFLVMWKHSMAPCLESDALAGPLHPQEYLRSQVDILLQGLTVRDLNKGRKHQ